MADRPSFRQLWQRLGPAAILVVIGGSLPAIGGFVILGIAPKIGPILKAHELIGLPAYIVAFWILGGLAAVPTYAHSALGGWSFGFAIGLPAAILSFGGASAVGYLIAQRASGDRVTQLISEHRRWQAVYDALLKGGFWRTLLIIILVRIPPSSPFAITNVVMAATRVPLVPYILGTMIGIAPRTAFVVYTAAHLHSLKDATESRTTQLVYLAISVAIGLILIAVVTHMAKRALNHVCGPEQEDPTCN